MALSFEVSIKLPLADAPSWLSHIELTRDGDEIVVEVIKENGLSYGECRLPAVEFNEMADLLLTPGS